MSADIALLIERATFGDDASWREICERLERYEKLSHEHGKLEAECARLMAENEALRRK